MQRLLFQSCLLIAVTFAADLGLMAQDNSFVDFARRRIAKEHDIGSSPGRLDAVCAITRDKLADRVFYEYGAIFVASREVRLPPACVFQSSADAAAFQEKLDTKKLLFGDVETELQEEAMERLKDAIDEASRQRLKITPLDGAVAGRRSYDDTVRIWNSRFYRALEFWVRKGKITGKDAIAARSATAREQIDMVMAWEEKKYYFSTDFSKSIFYSVAPPGTSQHLSLLAFDVVEAGDPRIRKILNRHGWFQTIRTDQPHFTFLGVDETELQKRGLQQLQYQGNNYWVPSRVEQRGVRGGDGPERR